MTNLLKRLVKDEEGQGLAEYGLILAGVAIVVIGAVWALGGGIEEVLENVTERLPGPTEEQGTL